MKRALFIAILLAATTMAAQVRSFRGTVTRMQMTVCMQQHGFVASMAGGQPATESTCPEYTIMSDKVVYVVVARRVEEFIPLAEQVTFLTRKNELIALADDEKHETKLVVRQMILRADWDREEARRALEDKINERRANYEVRNPPRTTLVATESR